jgi:hypothetical protein
MRLGLLGPSPENDAPLEQAARFLLHELAVDRAIYLGIDPALDRVVHRWAERLVEGDPGDAALFSRAAARCAVATAQEIEAFLEAERERRTLKVFESLPGDGTRVIELLGDKVVVMIYDKAHFDEEDILPASVLVFGKSEEPVVKQVGSRWFLAPGSFMGGGVMTLEDSEEGIRLAMFDEHLKEQGQELLRVGRGAKLKVSGAAGADS